mgnify:CR=1 FL=1
MDREKRYYVWGRKSCPFCLAACELLYSKNKLYDFFDHEGDEKFIKRLMDFYDHYTVPVVVESDQETGRTKFIGGYDDLETLMKEGQHDRV